MRSRVKFLGQLTLQDQTCCESSSMALSCLVVNFFGPTEMLKNNTCHQVHVHTRYIQKNEDTTHKCWTINIKIIKLVLQTSQEETSTNLWPCMNLKNQKSTSLVDCTQSKSYLGLATLWRACWTSYQVTLKAEATATPCSPPLQSSAFLSGCETR